MAIQVYRKEQNFNAPIGVAGVSQAPTRLANTFSKVSENITGMAFDRAVEDQKQEAIEDVANFTMRDENGDLVVKSLPDSYSRIQKGVAQPILDKMYAQQYDIDVREKAAQLARKYPNNPFKFKEELGIWEKDNQPSSGKYASSLNASVKNYEVQYSERLYANLDKQLTQQIEMDIKTKGAELARAHPNDPEGFLDAFNGWAEGYGPSSGQYQPFVDMAVESYGLQHANALYVDKANLEDRVAFNNASQLLSDNVTDIERSALDYSPQFNNAWLTKSLEQVDELLINYPSRFSSTNADTFKKRIFKAFAKVPVDGVVNQLANTIFSSNPETQSKMLEASINKISLALRGVNTFTEDDYNLLSAFGFTKEYLANTPQVIKSDLASELTNISNTLSENYNLELQKINAAMSLDIINNNGVVSTDKASNVLKTTYGIETVEDFMNVYYDGGPDNPKSPHNDITHPINKFLVNQRQALPKVVRDMFSKSNQLEILAKSNFDIIRVNDNVKLFNRITRDRTNQFMSRGFSDETITFMTELEALSKTAQATDIGGVLSRLTDPTFDIKARSKFVLGEDTLPQYIGDNFNIKTPQEFNFVNKVAPQLLAVYGKDLATDIIEQTLNRRFYRKGSKYMVPEFAVSQFAPESLYSGDDLEFFDFIIETALSRIGTDTKQTRLNGQEPVMGKNVFLMEPRNIYGPYPDYIVVDEDNVPILTNGEMLTIPRAGMIKHHKDLGKFREEEMMDFRTRANKGPYLPTPSQGGNIQSQIQDIENR